MADVSESWDPDSGKTTFTPVDDDPFPNVTLTPVDHDPFPNVTLTPVDHDPFPNITLTPVDHDPGINWHWSDLNNPLLSSSLTPVAAATANQDPVDHDPGIDWSHMGGPNAELRAATYEPSERMVNATQDAFMAAGAQPYAARHMAEGLGRIAGLTPLGAIPAAADAVYEHWKGDDIGALTAMVGLIPAARPEAEAAGEAIREAVQGIRSATSASTVVRGIPVDAKFAQKTYGSMFSSRGDFRGMSVDNVAAALKSGTMKPADVTINYIVRNGQPIILNTRSSQALEAAGIPRSLWNGVDRTGELDFERRLDEQLSRNPGGPFDSVRRSGAR